MKRIELTFSLLSCIALSACDSPDSLDELEQLTASPRVRVPPASAELKAASAATAQVQVQKVKPPAAEHMVGWVRWANAQPFATGSVADPSGEQ